MEFCFSELHWKSFPSFSSSMYSLFSAICLLMLLQVFPIGGKYSVRPPNNPVIGYLEKEVMLPCMINILEPLAKVNITIQWTLEKSEKIGVKNYNRNQGETQDERYKDRTKLFVSEINKGNMSLLLKNISLFDQGLYTCKIFLDNWYDKVVVQLVLTANGGYPTIGLAVYKDQGIGLTCTSEGWYPQPKALWLDSKEKNQTENSAISATEIITGIFKVFGSITLPSGGDSEVSCKIINSLIKNEKESRIFISDVFYPTISSWIGPFVLIFVLFICIITFVAYKLINNFQENSKFEKEINEMKNEREKIKHETECCQNTNEGAIADIKQLSETFLRELEFRKIQSHAVTVYLDSECKHPNLTITKDQKKAILEAFGEATSAGGSLVVVGKEGYVAGKHYWEVKVGDRLDWELGVLTQVQRDRARNENFSVPLGKEYWALSSVRGDLFSSQNKEKIEKKSFSYSNIGLFLDQESRKLCFYNACIQNPFLITTITIQSTEKLYPFLNFLSFNECASEYAPALRNQLPPKDRASSFLSYFKTIKNIFSPGS